MIDDMRPRLRGHTPGRPIPRPVGPAGRIPARPVFRTPEAVAAAESMPQESPDTTSQPPLPEEPLKIKRPPLWKRMSKKQRIVTICILVLLLGGGAAAFFLTREKKPEATPKATTTQPAVIEPPKPTTVASELTGLQVAPEVNTRPVTAIMIENSMNARPQSALDQAGVVFEAVAEGGITRFLTLWLDTQPDYIGPVRSVRPYYIQWAMGFDASIAHVGGSADALNYLKTGKAKDLDQFAGGAYFWRISSREAPHNVYTSMAKLNEYEAKKGYGDSVFKPFIRTAKETPAKTPTATSIDFNISGAYYNSHYDYDATTNTYKRSEGGAPHMVVDAAGTQAQITPKVVVALIMPQGADGKYTTYSTIGTGQLIVFQDGVALPGTWRKDDSLTNFAFFDPSGNPLKINAGQTWLTVLGSVDRVAYK